MNDPRELPMGWVCPLCGGVNSPWAVTCMQYCGQQRPRPPVVDPRVETDNQPRLMMIINDAYERREPQ